MIQKSLDRLHARVAAWWWAYPFTAVTRGLLALAFIPSGMVKLLGHRFTTMPIETPVGFFFEAMYRTGFYWNFLGAAQVCAALLLIFPRTATAGAVVFFPIILNIFLITASVGFKGTPVITGLMLLAALYLLCWDYPRLKSILFPEPTEAPRTRPLWSNGRMLAMTGTVVLGAGPTLVMVTRGLGGRASLQAGLAMFGVCTLMGMWQLVAGWRAARGLKLA
ncbi:MAG TPA: hypothetical protein VF665_24810 [Longimicrobium sp.]|jgi:hypothetical protein|uniref:hypothetical protein n=1 Tax=Longimicrobium sp. TaxID=2029185 RepID=UPI002EDA313D